ncbi:hypothetical protein NDU88_005228 [Pleurodeles waltl]|uniref:Uncharacterized protein n=1 Tax=Pleurodeles waltl TaxID=8319 RepID=A0AAV7RKD5_PLEWA|nr:hypothetical protein NDU88_005228 [Pleurodeles waltl]
MLQAREARVVPLLRAALELLRVREAAAHVSYRGNNGRTSTGLKLFGKKRRTLRNSEVLLCPGIEGKIERPKGIAGSLYWEDAALQLNGTTIYLDHMVDRARGVIGAKKEGGKVSFKNGLGQVAYSLRSAKKNKKRVEVESLDPLQKPVLKQR